MKEHQMTCIKAVLQGGPVVIALAVVTLVTGILHFGLCVRSLAAARPLLSVSQHFLLLFSPPIITLLFACTFIPLWRAVAMDITHQLGEDPVNYAGYYSALRQTAMLGLISLWMFIPNAILSWFSINRSQPR